MSESSERIVPEDLLKRRRRMHAEKYLQYEPEEDHDCLADLDLTETEMYDYAFHRGMARMAGLVLRESKNAEEVAEES